MHAYGGYIPVQYNTISTVVIFTRKGTLCGGILIQEKIYQSGVPSLQMSIVVGFLDSKMSTVVVFLDNLNILW